MARQQFTCSIAYLLIEPGQSKSSRVLEGTTEPAIQQLRDVNLCGSDQFDARRFGAEFQPFKTLVHRGKI